MNMSLLAGSLFAISDIYLLGRALRDYKKALANLEWSGVEGRLTDLRLWGKRHIDGEMKDTGKLIVEYEYEFNGTQYRGAVAAFYTLVYPETVVFASCHSANSDVAVIAIRRIPMSPLWWLAREKTSPIVIVFSVCWGWLLAW